MQKYEFIYEKNAEGERQICGAYNKAVSEEDKVIVELAQYKNKFKLVYEKDGNIYGSETGVPAENDELIVAVKDLYGTEVDIEVESLEKEAKEEPQAKEIGEETEEVAELPVEDEE